MHADDINADVFPGHLYVPSFEARMRCGICGSNRVSVRPAWHTRQKRETISNYRPVKTSNVVRFPFKTRR
jgi:hypothetical protein